MLDSLGDRMKRYEQAARTSLPPRMPVILRIDGKAFHTWTRGLQRPFDRGLYEAMNSTAVAVCQEAQGAQIAYVQSDEINVLLHNYKRHASEAWFDNQAMKMCSVAASTAAAWMTMLSKVVHGDTRPATFDCRAFVLPEAEVCNYFVWRQQDAVRNSIQMLARSLYSHKECHLKTCADLQEMTFQKGHNWNDEPAEYKRGRCIVRGPDGRWSVEVPPTFSADRAYIERHLATEPEDLATETPTAEATKGPTP